MTSALAETLRMIARAAENAADKWWIIGSAAVVLHGAEITAVKDVDLMMSAADAEAFLSGVGGERQAADRSERFYSRVFGTWNKPPRPVKVFGDFHIAVDNGWREVRLSTRERVSIAGADVYVPSAEELAALLWSFGRPKDFARAKLLRSK